MFFKFYHLAVLKTKNIFQWFDVKRNKVHFHVSICEYPNVHQLFFKNWRGYFNNQSPQFSLGRGNISDVLKTISLLTMEHTFILSLFFSIFFLYQTCDETVASSRPVKTTPLFQSRLWREYIVCFHAKICCNKTI